MTLYNKKTPFSRVHLILPQRVKTPPHHQSPTRPKKTPNKKDSLIFRLSLSLLWQGFALATHRSPLRRHFCYRPKVTKTRCYAFFLPSAKFVRIPRISAHATAVIVILPKLSVRPPIPEIRITETVKRFLLSSRSTA